MKNRKLTILYVITTICILLFAIFAYKGYDKMTNYYYSEYSTNDINAYVGGDAYNYIINGNYATGYFVLAIGFFVSGTICFTSSLNLNEHKNEICEQDIESNDINNKELPPL